MTGPAGIENRLFRLSPAAEIVPAPDIPTSFAIPGDVLAGLRGSRQPPCLLSADTAALLEHFRTPRTLADGIRAHCRESGADPVSTLDECFGVLVALSRHGLLEPADTSARPPDGPRHAAADVIGPATLDTLVRQVRDTEIWLGHLTAEPSRRMAVKIVDEPVSGRRLVSTEAAALRMLDGDGAPRLHAVLPSDTGGVLITDWVDGRPVDLAATDGPGRCRTARRVLARYAALHALGVLHGDVHPGNILATADGEILLLDFGLAALPGQDGPPRPAGGEALDPQAAGALRDGIAVPPLDPVAEQYALATVLFRILCGTGYLDLDAERGDALRRIADDLPRRFAQAGGPCWPAGERVLRRALRKDPKRRYPDLAAMLAAFDRALDRPARWFGVPEELAADLRRAVADLDVGGRWWGHRADPDSCAHAAGFLRRAALLAGDPDAADLAAMWRALAGGRMPSGPRPGSPAARFEGALRRYRRTGRAAALATARRLAAELARTPDPGMPHLHTGPLAALLASLECADPWQADAPSPLPAQTAAARRSIARRQASGPRSR
jgi:serine/threonine-protein kinase